MQLGQFPHHLDQVGAANDVVALAAAVAALALAALSVHATGPSDQRVLGDGYVESGGAIYVLGGSGWQPVSDLPPVAPDNVASIVGPGIDPGLVITTSGEGWVNHGSLTGRVSSGLAPGSPTPAVRSTWGEVKQRYP